MICQPCRDRRHEQCKGRTWCDCQHRTSSDEDLRRYSEEDTTALGNQARYGPGVYGPPRKSTEEDQ